MPVPAFASPARCAAATLPLDAPLAALIAAMIADGTLRCAGIAPDGSAYVESAAAPPQARPRSKKGPRP